MSGSPRIVHVSTVHQPFDNRIFHKECRVLVEAGYDVHLVVTGISDHQRDGVTVHGLPRRSGRLGRLKTSTVNVRRKLLSLDPHVIHVHDPELIPVGLAVARKLGCAFVYDSHEDLVKQLVDKPYLSPPLLRLARVVANRLIHYADRYASAVVVAEPPLVDNFPNAHTVLVQNFPWRREFSEASAYPRDGRALVYVGGVSRGRGLSEMLALAERSKATEFVLAGPVTPEALEDEIAASSKTEYLGRIPVEKVPETLASANIGLCLLHPLPNYVDAQSTKVFEYMAAARPFIYSNFPRWVEMFQAHGVGIAVDPFDEASTVAAVDALIADPEAAAEAGQRGRRVFEEHFCFEAEGPKLVALMNQLVGPAG